MPRMNNNMKENSGISIQGFIKITDPETGKIYVQKRS